MDNKQMRIFFVLFLLPVYLKAISISYDPSWYPLDYENATPAINAYIQEAIKKLDSPFLELKLFKMPYLNLFSALESSEVDGILSAVYPKTQVTVDLLPSILLLETGPILVVRKRDKIKKLKQLAYKTVGVSPYDRSTFVAQSHPSIVIKSYENMTLALQDLATQVIDGVLLSNLDALTLLHHYPSLQTVGSPLTEEGIRFYFLRTSEKERLKKIINKKILEFQSSGSSKKLLEKYLLL